MSRRFIFALLAVVVVSHAFAADATKKPNVLLLVADDLCADLGCYGAPVKSPNIDKLASQGVRFERAYCQFPLCGPSRCSFLSGLRPETVGVITNNKTVRDRHKEIITFPQFFRLNGYFVARVGKLYHLGIPDGVGASGPDDPLSWDYVFNPKGAEFTTDGDEYDPNPKNGQSFHEVQGKGDGHEQHDYQAATEAIRLLNEQKDKPFFLAVGFIRPHVPELAPKSFFDLYDLKQITIPTEPENDRSRYPAAAFYHSAVNFGMTLEQCRRAKRAYYATTSFMDAQVGRVLDELDRLKLRDNTIVIFMSDHGYSLGEHQAWQKQLLFENSCRVPIIISAPGMKGGVVARGIVESIDLYPTAAELCGLTAPKALEGTSLRPMLQDPSATVNDAALTIVRRKGFMGRSIRTDRFRYTEWGEGAEGRELYDEQADPREFNNLAGNPAFVDTVNSLAGELHKRSPNVTLTTTRPSHNAGGE
jgi:uncharacterized sulfatase